MIILLILCCCFSAAVQAATPSTSSSSSSSSSFQEAAPLQFVSVTRAGGCPLTLYHHSNSIRREAFLAPAFCIVQDMKLLLATACLKFDPVMSLTYLSLPVVVTDSRLLEEARKTLSPMMLDRTLAFLQPRSVRSAEKLPALMQLVWETHWETAFLRINCRDESCLEILSQFAAGRWDAVEQVELKVTLMVPGSQQPISVTGRIFLANKDRILTTTRSPSVLPARMCENLTIHRTLTVYESCSVNVLQRMDRKGHFVLEPMLCYRGNYTSYTDEQGGMIRLALEVRSLSAIDNVVRELSHLSPASITFLSIVGAELQVSESLKEQWNFERLRLAPDGHMAELQVRCGNKVSCGLFIQAVTASATDLWRHVTFSVESELQDAKATCSWQSQATGASMKESSTCETRAVSRIPAYHPIDGLLCIRPPYVRRFPLLSSKFCAVLCSSKRRCQAYSTESGSCQLFLFDRCSKDVRDCSCDRRGRVFVKAQPGLEPGRLCPAGFGDDRCGVKYRVQLKPGGDWDTNRNICESASGLVIMADIADRDELRYVANLVNRTSLHRFWLGGYQPPGSEEPAGGWTWASCNTPLVNHESGLWRTGEPNNYLGIENALEAYTNNVMMNVQYNAVMNDAPRNSTMAAGGVACECVSPF